MPIRINPVKAARLSQGLTIDELADELSLSRVTIIRTEQGVYTEPSQVIITGLGLTQRDLSEYKAWQYEQRENSYGVLVTEFNWHSPLDQPIHPLVEWREASSLNAIGFCKAFCYHPATLHRFENQPGRCRAIPPDLIHVLKISGYDPTLLEKFERAWDKFKWSLASVGLSRAQAGLDPFLLPTDSLELLAE